MIDPDLVINIQESRETHSTGMSQGGSPYLFCLFFSMHS